MEIKARLSSWPKERESFVAQFDLPTDLEGLTKRFGPEVVAAKAVDSIVIDVQALIRRLLAKEGTKDAVTPEDILKKVADHMPSSNSAVRRSPQEKVQDLVGKMSPEEKKALLKQLREGS